MTRCWGCQRKGREQCFERRFCRYRDMWDCWYCRFNGQYQSGEGIFLRVFGSQVLMELVFGRKRLLAIAANSQYPYKPCELLAIRWVLLIANRILAIKWDLNRICSLRPMVLDQFFLDSISRSHRLDCWVDSCLRGIYCEKIFTELRIWLTEVCNRLDLLYR